MGVVQSHTILIVDTGHQAVVVDAQLRQGAVSIDKALTTTRLRLEFAVWLSRGTIVVTPAFAAPKGRRTRRFVLGTIVTGQTLAAALAHRIATLIARAVIVRCACRLAFPLP